MVWGAFSYGGNYRAASCAGATKRSRIHRHVRPIIIITEGARLCIETRFFFNNDTASHTTRRSKDFHQANNIHLLDHPPA